ncbi:nuclear transport factor 2 family protein [Fulvivirga sp. 29W222]|uniref:Nuclear transport factor 2 family protein n=1 Tax=Fulvivirga marina TaxID=2494733 RepID=A0A937FU85_9BACT|nr:nuclear transport factor 2 family protein [Fulvivirga marina]MBL6445048.1 nuclear transport factor 2 family protein [Fulvivirga marina]
MKRAIIIFLLGISLVTQAQEKDHINTFLNNWHKAAAEANADIFFGSIANEGIYIGTDATERWDKESFWAFSKPYFDRGKAWNFKPYDRQLHFSEDGKIAWFSELLDTWMGVCRGSGVLRKSEGSWQILQYHLSVTVPNDDIHKFIELINKEK